MDRSAAFIKLQASSVPAEYRPLAKYLDTRYADTIVLTFGEIEDLLGCALPELARSDLAWWSNSSADSAGSDQSRAWVQVHRVATPNLRARNVRFDRAPG